MCQFGGDVGSGGLDIYFYTGYSSEILKKRCSEVKDMNLLLKELLYYYRRTGVFFQTFLYGCGQILPCGPALAQSGPGEPLLHKSSTIELDDFRHNAMRIIIIIQTTDNPQFNPPRSPTLAPDTFPRLAQYSFILYNKKPFQNHPAPKTNIF